MRPSDKNIYTGIGLAVLATVIWSGNFIIARGVNRQIPPISLAFYRWLLASVVIFPFSYRAIRAEWPSIRKSIPYLLSASLTGIALFNTFVYVGAHYTTAINLALIGTTSSPVMAIILARIFLKEQIGWMKLMGLLVCILGVLILLSAGNLQDLLHHQYSKGDLWVLAAALCFAMYTILVRKKPSALSPISFLSVIFFLGTLMLFPFFIWESGHTAPIAWDLHLVWQVAYLGLAASVICFLIWNSAIGKLGAGRTALFGNLIPVFSSIEAVAFLHEQFTCVHVLSMIIIFAGILLANFRLLR